MNLSRRTLVLRTRPPDILKTQNVRVVDEQDLGDREKPGTLAPALVLHGHAQNVWQRPDAGEATDAPAGDGLGRHRDGGGVGPEAQSVAALYSTRESAHCLARWVSVLSGRQFCRGQESWFD